MRKLLFLLVITLLFSASLFAQIHYYAPGFVITNEGDSIQGEIALKGFISNSTVCTFRKNKDENTIDYSPKDISAYGFNEGRFYLAKDIYVKEDSMRVFLEVLIDGIVDMYLYRTIEKDYFFAEREGIDLIELRDIQKIVRKDGRDYAQDNKEFMGILMHVFNESRETQKKVETIKLTPRSLIKVAKNYHDNVCNGEECIIYTKY